MQGCGQDLKAERAEGLLAGAGCAGTEVAGQGWGYPGERGRGTDGVNFSVLRLYVMARWQSTFHCYSVPRDQNFGLLKS